MINSIPSVSFGTGPMDKVTQEQIYNPGLYAQPVYAMQEPSRKKGGFFSFLGKLILIAAVIGGGAVAARKFIKPMKKEALDVTNDITSEASLGSKIKYHTAKAADYIEEKSVNLYEKAKGILKKNDAEVKA